MKIKKIICAAAAAADAMSSAAFAMPTAQDEQRSKTVRARLS